MTDRVEARRTIEALRSGVPSRHAVRELGSSQPHIETRFRDKLELLRQNVAVPGLLFGGDFGTGKSHLIEFLQNVALEQRFVASKIVISKETPLHDPVKVFRAAISNAVVPGRQGAAVAEIAETLEFDGPRYDTFKWWVSSAEAALNERFASTLYLYRDLRREDPEFADKIIRFWSGDPIALGELKRKLREAGEAATFVITSALQRELALQRFRFLAQLSVAAGFGGFVLFLDEVELIGRYSLLQRAKSYAEIARWLPGIEDEPLPGLLAVLAITEDFVLEVLDGKNDYENVPGRLRLRGDAVLADRAEQGMQALDRDLMPLARPDTQRLTETHDKLRDLHGAAYGWQAPDEHGNDFQRRRSMREYVREWINEWDLRRLDPSYRPEMKFERVVTDYREEAELDPPPEGPSEPEQ
jgi:BREX system ATP-binding protein BrxC/D